METHPSPTPVEAIAACHPRLREVAQAAVDEWHPEAVPVTSVLSDLGRLLVESEADIDDATLDRIAGVVEGSLAKVGAVADAVATGFLEAVVNRTVSQPATVRRIVSHLGPRALAYIRAWDEFTGVKTAGAWPDTT